MANNPLIATVSGLFGRLTITGCGFAGKGTKILRHWGSKGIRHCEGGTATLHATNIRNNLSRHCEEWNDEAISLKLQASVQRNVVIASNRDLREQNTECAVRRSNDAVGAVPIHSNVRFSFFGSFSFFLHHDKKKEMNNKKRDCFTAFAMTSKRSFAFTLSEVLIVLAVLGVIAAMTIPDLIQDYREKALVTALKKNYSIFEQAVEMAQIENGHITGWDIGTAGTSDGAMKLYNILKPYLRIEKECGTEARKGCFANGQYKKMFGGKSGYSPDNDTSVAKAVLSSGASFGVDAYGSGCSAGTGYCGLIRVDVNGKAGPNQRGVDYFEFIIATYKDQEVIPVGFWSGSGTCIYGDTSASNGLGCTYWVIKQGNMDYLRKAGKYTK